MLVEQAMLINGEWRTGERTFESRSPLDDTLLGTLPRGSAGDIDAAVRAAQAAFPAWRDLGERERCRRLRRLYRIVGDRRDELAELIHRETGKPQIEALTVDLLSTLNTLDYYSRRGTADLRPERIKPMQRVMVGHRLEVIHEPVGVVGIIGPWNLPLGIPVSQIVACLVVGNTVVFKPSEWTPLVALAFARACTDAGIPAGVLNVVTGEREAGAALAEHGGTRRIIFTGSVATGRRVAETCARRLCPCVLELGGVGAAIVRADADIQRAARGIVWSRFVNNGQTCVAVERVYVDRRVAGPFTEAVVRETQRLRPANGARSYDLGPLINDDSLRRIEQQVADAVAHGATIRTGGRALPGSGALFYAPTVLTGVTPQMRVMYEETFGPVLPIMPVSGDDEAIAHANSLPYGLGMSIWTADDRAGVALGRALETGMVWINEGGIYFVEPTAPWGGVKQSGIGRTHGRWGLEAVTDLKLIARTPGYPRPWWFPYRPLTGALLRSMVALVHPRGWRETLRALAQAWLVR